MGGRKPSPLRNVVGNLAPIRNERAQLNNAIEKQDPKQIALSTLNLFRKSKYAISNLSNAIDMRGVFLHEKKRILKPKETKDFVREYWNKVKQKKKLSTIPEIDRILIDSASKILKRRGKK